MSSGQFNCCWEKSSCLFCLFMCLFWRVCSAEAVAVGGHKIHVCCVTSFQIYLHINKSSPQALFTRVMDTCQHALWLPAYFKHVAQVCVFMFAGCVQSERGTQMSHSSSSAPALHLPAWACWEILRYRRQTVMPSVQTEPESRMAAVGTDSLPCLIKTESNLDKNTDFWCIIELKTVGMCAELPPGAFRSSGGFHCRGRCQRLLLSQSPDLTCRRVVLQCLRWQCSLTIYGKTVSPNCSISSLVFVCVRKLQFLNFMLLQGVINLESLGKRGYRVPPSGTIQVVREPFCCVLQTWTFSSIYTCHAAWGW